MRSPRGQWRVPIGSLTLHVKCFSFLSKGHQLFDLLDANKAGDGDCSYDYDKEIQRCEHSCR